MIISVILLIISFLIEGLMSNYVTSFLNNVSLFSTMYTLVALIVIYPYFHNEKKYYILLIIFASLVDIVYTNTFLLNVFLFLAISFVIKILNYILPDNILMVNILSVCAVILYHIFSYLILTIINYNTYSISLLFDICINSIFMTVIFASVLYFIAEFLFNKFDTKQIR